jgi:hypothetical protein
MKAKQSPLNTPQPIPLSFWTDFIPHEKVAAYFGWSEPEFWARYTSHQLPMGVNLMALCGTPYVVFRIDDLAKWEADGCPPQAGSIELLAEVSAALVEAFRSAGVIFPDTAREFN